MTLRKYSTRARLRLAATLTAVCGVYFATSAGVVSSNDGAHFATARSIARDWSFALGDGAHFATVDVCRDRLGRLHANRPVGTGVLFALVYRMAAALPAALFPPMSSIEDRWIRSVEWRAARHAGYSGTADELLATWQAERPAQLACTAFNCCLGVAALALAHRLARALGIGEIGALTNVFALAFGTIQWRYATAMFSHLPAQFFLVLQVVWITEGTAFRSPLRSILFGCAAGMAMLCEYQALFTMPIIAVWFAIAAKANGCGASRNALAAVLSYGAIAAFIGIDQWHRFGSPFRTPMSASVYFDYAGKFSTMFGSDPFRGAYTLYFSRYTNGLCWISWSAAVAGIGWLVLLCNSLRERLGPTNSFAPTSNALLPPRLATWAIAAIVAIHSGFMVFIEAPYGGATADHRYLVYVLPLIMLPLGFLVDVAWQWKGRAATTVRVLAFIALFALLIHDVAAVSRLQANFMKHRAWTMPDATWLPS